MLVVPVAIRRRTPTDFEGKEDWWPKIKGEPIPHNFSYGKGLEIKITQSEPSANYKEFLKKNPSVQVIAGKNIHFFESNDKRTFLEVWPHGNHTHAEIKFICRDVFNFLRLQTRTPAKHFLGILSEFLQPRIPM